MVGAAKWVFLGLKRVVEPTDWFFFFFWVFLVFSVFFLGERLDLLMSHTFHL